MGRVMYHEYILTGAVLADALAEYEDTGLDPDSELRLFQSLVVTGDAWNLEGHYGRTAMALIEQGHIKPAWQIIGVS